MSTLPKKSLSWISTTSTSSTFTKLAELSTLQNVNVVAPSTRGRNLLKVGNKFSYSRIKSFSAGSAYIAYASSSIQVNYSVNGQTDNDNGRLMSLYTERFKITGLSGFYVNGNGDYIMATFFKNNKPCYINTNRWAIWYDANAKSWTMTETLNLHPSKSDYDYRLVNNSDDPAGGIYTFDGLDQSGYGPNSVRERVIVSIPTDSYESSVRKISTSETHTLFLDEQNNAWAVGYNNYGQLADDTLKDSLLTKRVSRGDASDLHSSWGKTFITKVDGSLWAVGYNNAGQLGISNAKTFQHQDGIKYARHTNVPSLTKIIGGEGSGIVLSVKSSKDHTLFLMFEDNDGIKRKNLYCMGTNRYGQLPVGNYYGNSTGTGDPQLIASDSFRNEILFDVGITHTMWVRQGTLYGSGRANNYQVGATNGVKQFYLAPYVVSAFGNVDVKKVSCGRENTFALLEDNTLWSTGLNTYGQCGFAVSSFGSIVRGFTKVIDGVKDVEAGNDHTIVLLQNGKLMSAGNNQYGQCATEKPLASSTWSDVNHSNGGFEQCKIDGEEITSGVEYIHADGNSTFLVKDGSVYACGYNGYGNLGDGSNDNLRYVTQIYPTG